MRNPSVPPQVAFPILVDLPSLVDTFRAPQNLLKAVDHGALIHDWDSIRIFQYITKYL